MKRRRSPEYSPAGYIETNHLEVWKKLENNLNLISEYVKKNILPWQHQATTTILSKIYENGWQNLPHLDPLPPKIFPENPTRELREAQEFLLKFQKPELLKEDYFENPIYFYTALNNTISSLKSAIDFNIHTNDQKPNQ